MSVWVTDSSRCIQGNIPGSSSVCSQFTGRINYPQPHPSLAFRSWCGIRSIQIHWGGYSIPRATRGRSGGRSPQLRYRSRAEVVAGSQEKKQGKEGEVREKIRKVQAYAWCLVVKEKSGMPSRQDLGGYRFSLWRKTRQGKLRQQKPGR